MSELEKLKAQLHALFEAASLFVSRYQEIEESWAQMPPEAKSGAEEQVDPKEIAEAQWTPYNSGKGEWAFSDKLPKLKAALEKAAGKKLDFEGYHYRLQGADNKFVARYPRKK